MAALNLSVHSSNSAHRSTHLGLEMLEQEEVQAQRNPLPALAKRTSTPSLSLSLSHLPRPDMLRRGNRLDSHGILILLWSPTQPAVLSLDICYRTESRSGPAQTDSNFAVA
ncbi:hypothetical protein VTN96DRAFT_1872 [Rasamsonia emersonii]